MGFDFNPMLCFVCRSCGQTFPDVDKLKTHKIECHLGECLNTKCIIFEEIVLGDEWAPPNVYTNRSGSDFEHTLISRNETIAPKTNLENFSGEQTFPFRNPYVSLRPLTSEELKSKTVATEIRTGVSCRATRKRSRALAEAAAAAATAQRPRSSNLASLKSGRYSQNNLAVPLLPKRTKFPEEVGRRIRVLNKESNETKTGRTITEKETHEAAVLKCGPSIVWSDTDGYNVSDIIKLEPESDVNPEVVSKIEAHMFLSFSEDPNDFTEDFLANSTNYEPKREAENFPDSFNDSSGLDDDDRPSTPDFSSLAEENTVLLPDNDTESQNQISPVNCGMCETQLVTAEEEKNHLDNCWLHNKSRHIYCVLCNIRFKYPLQLQKHQQNIHNEATDEFYSVTSLNLEDLDDEDDSDESADFYTLPLGKWIQKRRQRFSDLILLHPDPTDPSCLLGHGTTCKLCRAYLGSDLIAKDHVKTCWAFNKAMHEYCHICRKTFNWPGLFQHHNDKLHPFRSLPLPRIFCYVCHEVFHSFAELKKHAESMKEFFQAMTAKESLFVMQKPQDTHLAAPSGRSVNTSAPLTKIGRPASAASTLIQIKDKNPGNDTPSATNRLFERENKQKNLVVLENAILLDRSDKLPDVVSESSVMRCKLCLQLLGSKPHMKLHLENCWLHNKGRHIYCSSCQKHFQHPRALKFHNLREHSEEAGNEGVTNLTTVDEAGSNSSVASDLLPLGEWIQMRRRDYGDIIQFDPDPTLKKNKYININTFEPITCKLCKFIFKSKETVKGHAKICWFHNKQRHRFCVPCKIVYGGTVALQNHIRNHHLKIFPRPSFYCMECEQVFQTFEEFKTHEENREEFFKGVREANM